MRVTGIGGACIGCTSMVNSVAFQPSDDGIHSIPDGGSHIVEKRFATADGVVLHAYYLPNDTSDRVVIIFHGNDGNSTLRLSDARSPHELGAYFGEFGHLVRRNPATRSGGKRPLCPGCSG